MHLIYAEQAQILFRVENWWEAVADGLFGNVRTDSGGISLGTSLAEAA